MNVTRTDPPREFEVGRGEIVRLKDCARIELQPDEQVTFLTDAGGEYDFVRKSWGFYATPSLNGRLQRFGLRGVLLKSPGGKFYLVIVERGREAEFERYVSIERHTIMCWLDSDEAFEMFEQKLAR